MIAEKRKLFFSFLFLPASTGMCIAYLHKCVMAKMCIIAIHISNSIPARSSAGWHLQLSNIQQCHAAVQRARVAHSREACL
jgi:hypothetical protein